jgi:hypothetical protein
MKKEKYQFHLGLLANVNGTNVQFLCVFNSNNTTPTLSEIKKVANNLFVEEYCEGYLKIGFTVNSLIKLLNK